MVRRTLMIVCLLSCSGVCNITPSDPLFKQDAEVDYLIIAPAQSAILGQAQRLAGLKWEKGLRTRIVTVDSIVQHVQGADTCDKIRNLAGIWILMMSVECRRTSM